MGTSGAERPTRWRAWLELIRPIGGLPAASIRQAVERKEPKNIDDQTLILDDIAQKALDQVESSVIELLETRGTDPESTSELARRLSTGEFTHYYPIRVAQAREFGLSVSPDKPEEIYELMELYSQPSERRPAVQYVEVPYRLVRLESAPGPPPE